jgi:hypothetical protein
MIIVLANGVVCFSPLSYFGWGHRGKDDGPKIKEKPKKWSGNGKPPAAPDKSSVLNVITLALPLIEV